MLSTALQLSAHRRENSYESQGRLEAGRKFWSYVTQVLTCVAINFQRAHKQMTDVFYKNNCLLSLIEPVFNSYKNLNNFFFFFVWADSAVFFSQNKSDNSIFSSLFFWSEQEGQSPY